MQIFYTRIHQIRNLTTTDMADSGACMQQTQCLDPGLTYEKPICIMRQSCESDSKLLLSDSKPCTGPPVSSSPKPSEKPKKSTALAIHATAAPVMQERTSAIDIFSILIFLVMIILVSWVIATMIHGPCAF